jgi:CMP/dCMP kinase
MGEGFVIAIDGPVAAGKGTVASKLAEDLQGFYLYTGGTYRSVALAGIQKGIDLTNTEAVIGLLKDVRIQFKDNRVLLNGEDVTDRIKEPDAANGASVVASMPGVRKEMVHLQRNVADEMIEEGKIVVIEGRDTATVVFPNAALRVFLTASDVVRAKRRLKQYTEQGDVRDYESVLAEIRERDRRDTERETDPLVSNPEELGYFILDDSEKNEADTLEAIKSELKKRNLL